jgi:predicted acetyltransferase
MTVSVRDARTIPADRRWIASMYREYLDDLSPTDTGVFPALGEVGHSEPDQVERWFGDPAATPLLILSSQSAAGFAMVACGRAVATPPGGAAAAVDYRLAEFFVARVFRRRGVGSAAVPLILDRFAGRWEICEFQRNRTAVQFWRATLAHYTQGRFVERVVNGEVRHSFASGPHR